MPGKCASYSAMKDPTGSTGLARRASMLKGMRRGSQASLVIVDPKKSSAPDGALVADLMERAGSGWYQALVLPSLLGVTVIECGQVQLISSIVGGLQVTWGLSDQQKALLPALSFCGLAVGTLCSGLSSDFYGRRKTIIAGYALCCISSILLALAGSFLQMCFCAIFNGFAGGIGVTAAMVMITEVCPRSLRATAFVFPLLAQAVGEVYAVGMTEIFMPDLVHGNWRAVVLLSAVPAYVFLCVSYIFMRESPYWLVVQGRVLEARAEILEIAKTNRTSQNVEMLAQALDEDPEVDTAATKGEGRPGMLTVLRKALSSVHFVLMFVSFGFLCFLGQLLTFGMSYYWPQLLESPEVIIPFMNPATTLGLIRSFGIPSALLMIPIMQSQVGHRAIICAAATLEAATLYGCMVVLVYMRGEALVPLACLSLGCANLYYSVALLFMTESYPTAVRAVMAALSISIGRIGAIAGPSLVEAMGFKNFLAFTGALACSALPVVLSLAETKGKQLEDYLGEDSPGEQAPLMADVQSEASMSETDSERQQNTSS